MMISLEFKEDNKTKVSCISYAQVQQNIRQSFCKNGRIFEFTKVLSSLNAGIVICIANVINNLSKTRRDSYKRLERKYFTKKRNSQKNAGFTRVLN